ncbi:MAG: Fic family protein [Desulfobulbaceae bacterium]|nr:Fic family protein [Desulfobulbaceae bacterium]
MQTNQWIWEHEDWHKFTFEADKLLTDLGTASQLIGKLDAISQSISGEEKMATLERVLTDDAIETAAIEGEILRRSSVRSSIRKRIGLPVEKEDWDDRADGLIAMLFDARNRKPTPLTKERLFGWHAALFPTGYSGLKKIRVGKYRGDEEMQIVSGPIGKETVHYIAPPQDEVEKEMDIFLKWINTNDEHSPLLKAGIAHLWFIMIHPFDDGNGRVGRAITDFIMSINYPSLMQVISFSKHFSLDRKGYYKVLEQAGKQNLNITAWLKWFLRTTILAMQDAQWIVDRIVLKAHFWQQHKDTHLNSRQLKAINRLLDAGEKFEGGMTTRKYVGMTKCSKVTASRDLADLLNKEILQKNAARGRSTSYEIRCYSRSITNY